MVKVKLYFNEESTQPKIYKCVESPIVGQDWITLYLAEKNNTMRELIPSNHIEKVEWWFE
jgi:hypothetical protein